MVDIKVLLQAFNKPWLIEPSAALHYAEIFHKVLNGDVVVSAGMFGNNDLPYRANDSGQKANDGGVMVIPVNGPLMKNDFCGSPGTASMAAMIKQANADPSVKSIVLNISSPGGSVDGTEALAQAIAGSKKPVVAQGDMMGSAAYWAASQAKEVYLSGQTAMAGSIGTMAVIKDVRGFQDKNGVKEHVIMSSRSTDKNRAAMDAQDGNYEAYRQEFLNPINSVFENAVLSGRSGKVDLQKEDVATGKVYLGNNAIKVGLADRIGSLETAIRRSAQLAKQSQTSNNNTMAFEKSLKAANANEFQVVDGGFLLEEAHLNALETALQTSELNTANLSQEIQNLSDVVATSADAVKTANAQVEAANAENATLKAQIETLKKGPAASFSNTVKTGGDQLPSGTEKKDEFKTSVDEEVIKMRAELGIK